MDIRDGGDTFHKYLVSNMIFWNLIVGMSLVRWHVDTQYKMMQSDR